jgi:predicted branched-subunit amino acid permease
MSPSHRTSFLTGVKAELPILLGVFPFGMIYGALAIGAGMPVGAAQAMSAVVFAGSSQFIMTQLYGAGAPVLLIVLTAGVVNLRHMLYSASVAPYIKHLSPTWKALLAYLLTDEAFAVVITHYGREKPVRDQPGGHLVIAENDQPGDHWFFLGAGLALWSIWQISTALGILLGAVVPPGWSLDFSLALTFIALVAPALIDRSSVAAAVCAGVVALLGASLPYKLGLLAAALVGIAVGMALEKRK